MTEPLARGLERAGVSFLVEWIEGASRHPQRPPGLEVRRFGGAVAFVCPSRPEIDFLNRVHDLWPEDEGEVERIAGFYRSLGVRPWFELAPADGFDRLAAALAAAGASQIDFHTMLYGRPRPTPPSGSAVAVREVGPEELHGFVSVFLDGLEVKRPDRTLHAHWGDVPGWRLYLASVGGEPAGAAVLRIGDGVGYLAAASTLPRFRRSGCQAALIARRLADAAAAGCELVASQAAFASSSQRNLERAGLRIAFTKAVWRVRDRLGTSP